MIKNIIFLAFLLIITLQSNPVYAFKTNSLVLENGLQIYHIENRKIPAITHMLWYKTGASAEPKGKSGIAHLFEHLMFKETKNLKSGEFSKKIAFNGGNDNAGTAQDYTVYYQTIANYNLDLVMSLEAERMKNLIINEGAVKKEIDIVLEERNMRVDNNPRALLIEQIKESLYGSHPYATPVIGYRREVKNLTTKDAADFYKTYYSANNAILVVAGDVEFSEVITLAKKHFSKLKPSKLPSVKKQTVNPLTSSTTLSLSDDKVDKSEWLRYYLAPSIIAGEKQHAVALIILSQILGGGETSRLYQSLVVKQGLAVQASSHYYEVSAHKTTFGFYVIPTDDAVFGDISEAIEAEIKKIIKDGIGKKELARAKNLLKADAIYAQDGLKNMAFIYGRVLSTGLDESYVKNWAKNISEITERDIIKAADYVLYKKNHVTGILTKNDMNEVQK